MEGTLNEFAITSREKRPLSPFQDTGTTENIQKSCRRTQEKHGFADDMVFEILTWLPAKSLMRFRCVSKAWNSLIRHNFNFINLHNARSKARPPANGLLFEIITTYGGVVERASNFSTQLEGLSLQLARPHHCFDRRERIICSNHCNGLICFYSYKDTQVYLCNVTTGEIKFLPKNILKGLLRAPVLFLGFDLNTEKYKLLHVVPHNYGQYKIKILTLGTNSWRRIDEKYGEYLSSCCSGRRIFLNGVLYWEHYMPNTIAYFNFIEEKLGTISIPQRSPINGLDNIRSALWGKLVIYYRKPSGINEINEALNLVYDEVNKVFMTFNSDNPDLEKKKVALLEAENSDDACHENFVLATTSRISDSTSLVFPDHFWLIQVSSFIENIIPLTFIDV